VLLLVAVQQVMLHQVVLHQVTKGDFLPDSLAAGVWQMVLKQLMLCWFCILVVSVLLYVVFYQTV
jgi:hypothetical protein